MYVAIHQDPIMLPPGLNETVGTGNPGFLRKVTTKEGRELKIDLGNSEKIMCSYKNDTI